MRKNLDFRQICFECRFHILIKKKCQSQVFAFCWSCIFPPPQILLLLNSSSLSKKAPNVHCEFSVSSSQQPIIKRMERKAWTSQRGCCCHFLKHSSFLSLVVLPLPVSSPGSSYSHLLLSFLSSTLTCHLEAVHNFSKSLRSSWWCKMFRLDAFFNYSSFSFMFYQLRRIYMSSEQ